MSEKFIIHHTYQGKTSCGNFSSPYSSVQTISYVNCKACLESILTAAQRAMDAISSPAPPPPPLPCATRILLRIPRGNAYEYLHRGHPEQTERFPDGSETTDHALAKPINTVTMARPGVLNLDGHNIAVHDRAQLALFVDVMTVPAMTANTFYLDGTPNWDFCEDV